MEAQSLDANVLLRLVVADIPAQSEAAIKLVEQSKLLHVADTAVIEVVFALERYYEMDRSTISQVIGALLTHPKLRLNKALFTEAMPLFVSHSKLSMEDCCLATYAKLNKALPLWTFDRKLARQCPEQCRLLG